MKLNGTQIHLSKPIPLNIFLAQHGYLSERIAVEHNGQIVPKASYNNTTIADEDTLEIVSFVGGG